MTVQELDIEIAKAEKALFETKTLKEWDQAVRRYNALGVKRWQMTGEGYINETYSNNNNSFNYE